MALELSSLFISALLASTLLPGGSEITLAYLVHETQHSLFLLVFIATLGNTIGGMTSWWIGFYCAKKTRWKGLQQPKYQRAKHKLQRWGSSVLLLSWLPIIGDPLCLVAGWLNLTWYQCLFFIALGKGLRYIVIVSLLS